MLEGLRKGLLSIAVGISVVIPTFLSGCQSSPNTTSASATPRVAATATLAAKEPAKTVTIGMSQEPDALGAGLGSMAAANTVKAALGTLIDNSGTAALVWRNDKSEIIPGIAETVPTLENGGAKWVGDGADKHLEVTYKMRNNVKWHDGKQVTSKDAKFAWEMIMNPDFPAVDRSLETKIASIDTPDDYTAVYKYMSENQAKAAYAKDKKSYAEFEKQAGPVIDPLYNRIGYVVPSHILSEIKAGQISDSDYARKNPVGMGPYKLKEWVAGSRITLEANPDFFLGVPKIQTLIFEIIPDTNTILARLERGDLDVVTSDALNTNMVPDLDRIEQKGQVQVQYTPAMSWEHMDYNLDNEFLKDVKVRQAIAYAINRKQIIDEVLYGRASALDSWIPPISWAFNKDVSKYEYNPDKAKSLLSEAGFTAGSDGVMTKGGKALRLKLSTTAGNKMRELTTQIMQQNLKSIGVTIDLDFIPGRGIFENSGPLTRRTFDLALYAWTSNDDPAGVELWHSNSIPSAANAYSGQNNPGWRNTQNDDLLKKATASLDEKERKPLYDQQQVLFAQDLPTLPIFARLNVTASKAALSGFKPTPTATPVTWNVWEWLLPAK